MKEIFGFEIFEKMRLRDKIKCSETPSKIVQQVGKKSSLVGSAGASSGAHTAHHLDAVPMSTPCINVPKRNDITKNFYLGISVKKSEMTHNL